MIRNIITLCRGLTRASNPYIPNYYSTPVNHWTRSLVRLSSTEIPTDWPSDIVDFLKKENITKPTLIQEKTFEAAMSNKDLVGIARTGSGKTLGFVIPAVVKILEERKSNPNQQKIGPSCLILEPTRELANQTAEVFAKFKSSNIYSIELVGGSSRQAQMRNLSQRPYDVFIATPGRLNDLNNSNVVDLSNVKYVVLDEADRMLDMGFEPQVREILSSVPKERQTLMWSATWPPEIQDLAMQFMGDYEFVSVDSSELKANPNIKQRIEVCRGQDKFQTLVNHLTDLREQHQNARVLIFVNTKIRADQIIMQLMRNKIKAVSMHGNKSQLQRTKALQLFKDKFCDIMVATEVAARGLDINDITHVINYDMPMTVEDYIHRIGRTARYEKSGESITFLTSDDANIAHKLIKVLRETNQEVPEALEELATMRSVPKHKNYNYNNRNFGQNQNRSFQYNKSGNNFDNHSRQNQYHAASGFFD